MLALIRENLRTLGIKKNFARSLNEGFLGGGKCEIFK